MLTELNYDRLREYRQAGQLTSLSSVRDIATPEVIYCLTESLTAFLDLQFTSKLALSKPMTETKLDAMTETILQRYAHLSMEELRLFVACAFAGDFGPHYGKMDATIMSEWLQKFEAKRRTLNHQSRTKQIGAVNRAAFNEHQRKLAEDEEYLREYDEAMRDLDKTKLKIRRDIEAQEKEAAREAHETKERLAVIEEARRYRPEPGEEEETVGERHRRQTPSRSSTGKTFQELAAEEVQRARREEAVRDEGED